MYPCACDIVDVVSSIVTVLATVLAGSWAYYRFVRGRTFRPRFTLRVQGRTFRRGANNYLLLCVRLTNIGLSKIDIAHASARVAVLRADREQAFLPVRRSYLTTARIFDAHNWFEPGVTVYDEKLISLGSPIGDAVSVVCAVTAHHKALCMNTFRFVPRNTSVKAEAIIEIDKEPPDHNKDEEPWNGDRNDTNQQLA